MLQMFQKLLPPEQKKIADQVEKEGGKAILEDEDAMCELAAKVSPPPTSGRHGAGQFDLAELQHEIRGDPTTAIERNAEGFNRIFDVQRRQIEEEIARISHREGDRVISAVTAGPHDRIIDPVRPTHTPAIYKLMFNVTLGYLSNLEGYGKH